MLNFVPFSHLRSNVVNISALLAMEQEADYIHIHTDSQQGNIHIHTKFGNKMLVCEYLAVVTPTDNRYCFSRATILLLKNEKVGEIDYRR